MSGSSKTKAASEYYNIPITLKELGEMEDRATRNYIGSPMYKQIVDNVALEYIMNHRRKSLTPYKKADWLAYSTALTKDRYGKYKARDVTEDIAVKVTSTYVVFLGSDRKISRDRILGRFYTPKK